MCIGKAADPLANVVGGGLPIGNVVVGPSELGEQSESDLIYCGLVSDTCQHLSQQMGFRGVQLRRLRSSCCGIQCTVNNRKELINIV